MNQTIPVFYTIDESYVPYTAVSMASLVENTSPQNQYEIIVVHQGLTEASKQALLAFEKENVHIRLEEMEKSLEMISDRMENRLRSDYFALSIYFRIFIPSMFPEFDKAIYIDGDTVVNRDIAELFEVDLEGNLMGAAQDSSIQDIPEAVAFIEEAHGFPKTEYINSGMLVFDMAAMRAVKLDEQFLHFLTTYHFDCIAPDQDYLNAMTHGAIHYLPTSWNRMPVNGEKVEENPSLIHYNLFYKPWHYEGVAYEEFFWKYAQLTPYLDTLQAERSHFTEKDKRKDESNLRLLLDRGATIGQQEVTFASIFGQGIEQRLGDHYALAESRTRH